MSVSPVGEVLLEQVERFDRLRASRPQMTCSCGAIHLLDDDNDIGNNGVAVIATRSGRGTLVSSGYIVFLSLKIWSGHSFVSSFDF